MLDEEIGQAINIESISWQRAPQGDDLAVFSDFSIYMGLSDLDALGVTFDDNYIEGTRTLVYSTSMQEIYAQSGEWMEILLDNPYYFNGQYNLIIEITWSSGSGTVYAYSWNNDGDHPRSVKAAYGNSSGVLSPVLSYIALGEPLALVPSTFGSIKAMFR